MDKRTNRTPRKGKPPKGWRDAFLRALADTGNVRASCQISGVGWTAAYSHRAKDPKFAEQWDEAHEQSTDLLELEARRRAMKEKSDVLLIFLLKANRPSKYRENYDLKLLAEQLARAAPAAPSPDRAADH